MERSAGKDSLAYNYYVVVLLSLACMVSYMDRLLISILVEPIRAEFALSDTQLGLLMGFAFVLFYTLFGLPFGALADRINRRNLIIFGLVGWSLATAASAFAVGFATLLMARAMVGIGEATLSPSAVSTISDRFDRSRLAFALSIYASGVAIGSGLAFAFGGMLSHWASQVSISFPLIGTLGGWRLAMFTVGLAGLPLAALMLATMREAPRSDKSPSPPFSALVRHIKQHRRVFGSVFIGFSLAAIASFLPALWAPALFIRVHGMEAYEIGMVLGAIGGITGFAGVITGGLISDFFTRRGIPDAPLRVMLFAIICQTPFIIAAFLIADKTPALILLAIAQTLATLFAGLQTTTLQLLTPPRFRGRMMAAYLLVVTLIGMGLGPVMVGVLSDRIFDGPNALGQSLAVITGGALIISALILSHNRGAIRAQILIEAERIGDAAPVPAP